MVTYLAICAIVALFTSYTVFIPAVALAKKRNKEGSVFTQNTTLALLTYQVICFIIAPIILIMFLIPGGYSSFKKGSTDFIIERDL